MHKEYISHGTIGSVGASPNNQGFQGEVQTTPPVAEVLSHIDIEIDQLYAQIERLCNRLSCVCSNNPMHIPHSEPQINGIKEAQQPSEILVNLRDKLGRIERASSVLLELQRQLQI